MDDVAEVHKDDLVEKFKSVTGVDTAVAVKFLHKSCWVLEWALQRFYNKHDSAKRGTGDSENAIPVDDSDDEIDETVDVKPFQSETSRFGTWAELVKTTESNYSSDDDEQEAYYAGGSEHSGQQVLGPPSGKKKDIISDILKSAHRIRGGVEELEGPSCSGPRDMFTGTGYKLGQTENDSEVLVSESPRSTETNVVVLKLWQDGFNIDDGPLRSYLDPANKDFLDSVRKGLIPKELSKGQENQVLHLDLQDHHDEPFVPPTTPHKVKPFSGAGHVLGSPAPPVTGTQESQPANIEEQSRAIEIDLNQPIVNIAIRLPNGSRLTARFNSSHTIADVRSYIGTNHPEYAQRSYLLRTTIPAMDLLDHQTLEELKLNNSVITMLLH